MLIITLSIRKALRFLYVNIFISIAILFLTWLVHRVYHGKMLADEGVMYGLGLFNLSSENTIASWYASMLLFTTAMLALVCYWNEAGKADSQSGFFSHGWIFMSFIFILMSLDEMGSLHENAGKLTFLDLKGDGSWQSVIAIPLLAVILYLVVFAWRHLRKNTPTLVLLILGSLFFLSVPVQEHFEMEMWSSTDYSPEWQRPVLFVLLEEGVELLATLSFLAAMVGYLVSLYGSQIIYIQFKAERVVQVLAPILLAGATLALFFHGYGSGLNADEGIGVNWFPSSIHMLILLMFISEKKRKSPYTIATLLFTSAYFGINFYQVLHWEPIFLLRLIITIMLVAGVANLLYTLKQGEKNTIVSISLYAWAVSLLVSLIVPNALIAVIVFITSGIFIACRILFHNKSFRLVKSEEYY